MTRLPAPILCAAATLAPPFANAALLQDLFDGDCLIGPSGMSVKNGV